MFSFFEDGYELTEKYQAEAIINEIHKYIKYSDSTKWLVYKYDKGIFSSDFAESVVDFIVGHFAHLRYMQGFMNGEEKKFGMSLQSNHGINAVITRIRNHPSVRILQKELDMKAYEINCCGEVCI